GRIEEARCPVLEELAQVVAEVHEAPLGLHRSEAPPAEPGGVAVGLVVAEDRLGGRGALGVGRGTLGGAQPVLHGLQDGGALGGLSGGGAGLSGRLALLPVLLGGVEQRTVEPVTWVMLSRVSGG